MPGSGRQRGNRIDVAHGCPAPILGLRAAGDRVDRARCWELVRSVRPDVEIAVLPGPHLVLQASAPHSQPLERTAASRLWREHPPSGLSQPVARGVLGRPSDAGRKLVVAPCAER